MMTNAVQLPPQHDAGSARQGSDEPLAQIVRLFNPNRERVGAGGENWSTTLSLIQGVAKQVRDIHQHAHVVAEDASRGIREARAQAHLAEEQAEHARGEADLALRRAEHAELRVQALSQELLDAERRIEEADQRIAELTLWLRRVHDCMEDEFNNLTIRPLNPPRA